jgi:hypothetical protein
MSGRIAILLPGLGSGGAERVMLHLSAGLVERGEAVDLLLVRAAGAFLPSLDRRVRLIDLGARRALQALPALLGYLRGERPQALISNLTYLNLLAVMGRAWAAPATRLILIEHNDLALAARHGVRRWEKLFPLFVRCLYPRADEIVAVSQGMAAGLTALGLPQAR